MKRYTFTLVMLVVISIFLGVIALQSIFQKDNVSSNPGKFDKVTMTASGGFLYFFDTTTGTIYAYRGERGSLLYKRQLVELGQPLR